MLDLFGDSLEEKTVCAWDRRGDCVKSVRKGVIGGMTIYEKPIPAAEGAERAMMDGVRIKGVANLPCWTDGSIRMKDRMNFLARTLSGEGWPEASDAAVSAALE